MTRLGATAAILSGMVWLALTPFMATIGLCHGTCRGLWAQHPLIVRTLGRAVTEWGWIPEGRDTGDVLYFGYGRWFVVFYLLLIVALLALRRAQIAIKAPAGRLDYWGYRLLLASLILAALGDFASYGLGVFSRFLWSNGFGVEVFAWLGVMVGSVMYGAALIRQRVFHPIVGVSLIVSGLLMPLTILDRYLVVYAPNAQTLPLALAWTLIGVYLITLRSESAAHA